MYIVTGGAGFIGSAMIWRLNEAGIDDILVVDNLASSEKWRNLVNRRYRDYVHRDEFRRMVLEGRAPQKVEAIIHMGACSSTTERNADFLMDNNLHYSQMVCRYALEQGARLINASSAATYGDGSHGFSDSLLTTLSLRPPQHVRLFQADVRSVGLPRESAQEHRQREVLQRVRPQRVPQGRDEERGLQGFHRAARNRLAPLVQVRPPAVPRRRPDARFRVCEGLRQRHGSGCWSIPKPTAS